MLQVGEPQASIVVVEACLQPECFELREVLRDKLGKVGVVVCYDAFWRVVMIRSQSNVEVFEGCMHAVQHIQDCGWSSM